MTSSGSPGLRGESSVPEIRDLCPYLTPCALGGHTFSSLGLGPLPCGWGAPRGVFHVSVHPGCPEALWEGLISQG